MTGRILSIGECMVELMQVDGGLLRKGYAGDSFNTAYYARLCLPADWSVDYLTAIGTDTVSDDMLAFIAGTGVGTDSIRRVEGRSPSLYMIHLKDGERSFSYWRSVSAARALADDADHLRKAIEACNVIVFSGITLAILAPDAAETLLTELRRAKAAGKMVVFDPNIRPRLWDNKTRMLSTLSAGARAATLVMPSFEDEATHFEDADIHATIARYRGLGVDNIVVKDGANGVTLQFADRTACFVPAVAVARVVDTTSAGDSFNGAFLARYVVHGRPEEAAAFAVKIAAAVIGHHGALVSRENILPDVVQ